VSNELKDRPDIKRRQAAWGLRALVKHYGLGTQALTFDPDNPNDWVVDHCYITALAHNKAIASCTIIGDRVEVTINDIHKIIQYQHLDEFNPAEYGIIHRTAINPITLDKLNDIEADIDLPPVSQFTGPIVIIPREPFHKKPKVITSL
jgi:hypothetical protein